MSRPENAFDMGVTTRPCVLVFAGHDPSGGAGIQADIEAISAQGAHALPVITALTVQDQNRAYSVHPVAPEIIVAQAQALWSAIEIDVIKFGIVGSLRNANAIADLICGFQAERARPQSSRSKQLDVVLDPVLASGAGNRLAVDEACAAIQPLLGLATLITPNLPELGRLASFGNSTAQRAQSLLGGGCRDVLVKGGHADDECVINRWFSLDHSHQEKQWRWQRFPLSFHGSGCTLAAAIAGQLALGQTMEQSLFMAQSFTQAALQSAYRVGDGQLMPNRFASVGAVTCK